MEKTENLTAGEKIQNACVECMKEKMRIEDITVAHISNRAGIGKSTFYRHYKDIYDVYEQLVDGFMERCEKLLVKIFFEKTLSVEEAVWIFMKSGTKKDNELFYAKDAVLIKYSIEFYDAKLIEILYDKVYDMVVQVAKRVYNNDEAAKFGATFILNGNIIPIFSVLHTQGKLKFDTLMLSLEIFETEVEKWKQHQQEL